MVTSRLYKPFAQPVTQSNNTNMSKMTDSQPTSQLPPSISTNTTSATPLTPSSPPQKTILLINGPNLNLLGYREPTIYGTTTLASITTHLTTLCATKNIALQHFQSNSEGALIDRIHQVLLSPHSPTKPDAIIINPGAFTHTSVAIRDALLGVSTPFVELHISNVHARESFRHHSYLSDKAEAVICGLGVYGYVAAVEYWAWKWMGGKIEDAVVTAATGPQ